MTAQTHYWPFQDSDLSFSEARVLLNWWEDARAEKPFPPRSALTLDAIKEALPLVILYGVEEEKSRLLIRVWGSGLVAALGREMTGQYLDEIDPGGDARDRLLNAVHSGRPYIVHDASLSIVDKDYASCDVIVFPLGDEENGVTHLLAALYRKMKFRKNLFQG